MNSLTISDLGTRVRSWCQTLGVPSKQNVKLRRSVLLVLDMQNDFVGPTGQLPVWGGPAIIPCLARMVRAFRAAGHLVLFTRHLCIEPHKHAKQIGVMKHIRNIDTFLRDGEPGAEICTPLRPRPRDQLIVKYRYSAFFDTGLDTLLRIHQVQDVVVTGVATNICCQATAQDAFFRSYNVLFPVDGNGGLDEASHLAAMKTIALAYARLCLTADVLAGLKR